MLLYLLTPRGYGGMLTVSRRSCIAQGGAHAVHFAAQGSLRRGFCRPAGSGTRPATAQGSGDWPNRAVRVIVNFGPGGSTDNAMRPFADRLSRTLGQQIVIENKGGASGAIGIEAAVKSAPDGYNFLATVSLSIVIVPHLRKTSYDPLKDLVPVTQFTDGTLLVAVHPSVPVNSVQELAAYAKQNPGKLSWGTAGVGSYGHLLCEAFKLEAGVDILHVPYRGGGESLADFLAGVVQVHADPNTMPHVTARQGQASGSARPRPPARFSERAAAQGNLSRSLISSSGLRCSRRPARPSRSCARWPRK